MAKLQTNQKKDRNKIIAMLVGIVVVLAAIVFVVSGEIASKSPFLDNQKFATAMAEMMDTKPLRVSKEDLADIKYFEMGYDGTQYVVAIGGDDFIKAKNALGENEAITQEMVDMLKTSSFTVNEKESTYIFNDIKYLTGVKEIMVSGVLLPEDVSFADFTSLEDASFTYNGITSTKPFESLKLDKIKKLDISGNTIEDYSALETYADKITVSYSYQPVTDEEGNLVNLEMVPMTLKEYNESLAAQEAEDDKENSDGTSEDNEAASNDAQESENQNDDAQDSSEDADTTEEGSDDKSNSEGSESGEG